MPCRDRQRHAAQLTSCQSQAANENWKRQRDAETNLERYRSLLPKDDTLSDEAVETMLDQMVALADVVTDIYRETKSKQNTALCQPLSASSMQGNVSPVLV